MKYRFSRQFMSAVLVLTLLCMITVPALALTYTDVDDKGWSVKYISDLAQRGLLTGYDDGTFRPHNSITTIETLAVLSRFYTLSDEVKGWINDDYSSYVNANVNSSLSWAYGALSICLSAGIVTEDELTKLDLMANIEKEQLSVFLVRAIQLEKTALSLSDTELSFTDVKDITVADTGYIALLVSLGVITGSDNNKFLPHSGVTREVAAAMLSRSLTYIESLGIKLKIDSYNDMSKTEGIVYSAGSGSIRMRLLNGMIRDYTIPSSASVTVNGTAKMLNSQYVGCNATITMKSGAITKVEISSDATVTWVQGILASVVTSIPNNYIYVTNPSTGEKVQYNLTANTTITQDGKKVAYTALTTPFFITMKLVNNVLTELYSTNPDLELNGSITALDYGTTVTMKITDGDGALWYFPLNITSLPAISRGDTKISIDRLNVGDKVTVTIDDNKIKTISTEDSQNTVTGELMSITTTTAGTNWVVKDKEGKEWSLILDENASIYNGSTAILLSAISVGSTVKVTVYGSTATEIYLLSAASSSSKVTGTVLAVDTVKNIVTILVSGKLVYINTAQIASILKSSTGRGLMLSGIVAESTIVVYGSYSNSVNFNAVMIIVES